MVNLGKYLIFIFLVMIFTVGPSFAGDIKGKVVDSRTGEPVFGATVLIKELGKGTSTGLDGTYRLKNIERANINWFAVMLVIPMMNKSSR